MITNTTAKSTYIVASGVTEYAIGFTYKTNPDGTPQIKVYKNKLSNMPLIYGVDYTISDNGLNIVVDTAVEPGDRLDIIRNIPLVQLSDYVIGRIDPEQIESDFDASVMRDQQIESDIQFVGEVPQDHENRIQECESDIDDLESLVPAQATDENQLADKNFVNSSISTSTATFRGTYDSLAELEEATADDNDYGFVVSTDQAGNTVYSRYKYVSEQTSGLVFTPNTMTNNTLLQFVSGTMTYLADNNSWRLQAISDLGYTVDQTEPQSFWEDPMRGFVFSGTYEDGDVVSFVRETITTGSWVFEYNLNNSSFTADQWAAVNSNATAEKVALIEKVNNSTIIITQGGITKGSFTLNQSSGGTIALDAGGASGHEVIAFQAPTSENNYTWYRKYADGWVEQGQFAFALTKNTTTAVTLPVEMADIQYGGQISCANTTYNTATTLSINKKSTTQVNLWGYTSSSDNTISVHWEVKGMMAESEIPSYNSGGGSAIGGGGAGGPEDE